MNLKVLSNQNVSMKIWFPVLSFLHKVQGPQDTTAFLLIATARRTYTSADCVSELQLLLTDLVLLLLMQLNWEKSHQQQQAYTSVEQVTWWVLGISHGLVLIKISPGRVDVKEVSSPSGQNFKNTEQNLKMPVYLFQAPLNTPKASQTRVLWTSEDLSPTSA